MPPIHHHQIQGFFWGVIFKVSQPLDCFFFSVMFWLHWKFITRSFWEGTVFVLATFTYQKNMRLIHRPVNTQQSPVSWIPSNWILKGDRSLLISRKWVTRWWFQLSTITHLDGWGCVGSDGFHPHFKGGEIWDTRWWQLKYFLCSPLFSVQTNPIWRSYVSDGLVQSPTRKICPKNSTLLSLPF